MMLKCLASPPSGGFRYTGKAKPYGSDFDDTLE